MNNATQTESPAALIRSRLKAAGVPARAVSVRSDRGSIDVRIKSASVQKALVEGIARDYENVRRCEVSGEILCGGNTFVTVEYTNEALAALKAPVMTAFEALAEGGPDVDLGNGLVAFLWDRYYVTVMRTGHGEIVRAWGKDHAARQVAEWLANHPTEEVRAAA